jgi:hypothetical protein
MDAVVDSTGSPDVGAVPGAAGIAWRRALIPTALFFAVATAVYTYPLAFQPGSLLLGGVGDHPSEAALIGWTAHQLLHAPHHLYDTAFFYPYSHTEAFWQSVLVPGLLATPFMAVTGDALLATNVVVLLSLALSGVFTAALAWSLTGRAIPSLLAGVVFAFFPNRLDHLNSPMVQMGFLLPVSLWAWLRFLERARWRHLFVLGIALWGQSLSSLYYAFADGFLLIAVGLGHVLLRPPPSIWRLLGRGALGAAGLAIALAPFLAPYLSVHQALGFDRPEELADWFGMDLLSGLDPSSFSTLYHGRLVDLRHAESGLFAGFAVLTLTGAAVILAARPEGPERRARWVRWLRAALLAAGVTCLVAIVVALRRSGVTGHLAGIKLRAVDLTLPLHALPVLAYAWTALEGRRRAPGRLSRRDWLLVLGPATLVMYLLTLAPTLTVHGHSRGIALFHWVYAYVPGAAAFRAPGRWALAYALPLALVASIALAMLTERLPRRVRTTVAAGVLLIAMLECLPLPIPWERRPPIPAAHRWLAEQPGDFAIVVLPVSDARRAAWAMLWTTTHWKRLVNGAFVFVPPAVQLLADEEGVVDAAALAATLRSIYPLRYALVDPSALEPAEAQAWARIHEDPHDGVTFVGRFGPDDIYAVDGTPDEGPLVQRLFSADFVRRHPQADYALELAGTEPDARRRVEVRFNGRLLATHDGAAQRVAALPSPYRTGDRNELTFTHIYDLDQTATRMPEYRIGRTGVQAPVDIEVTSAIGPDARASLRVNGLEQLDRNGRGYVIAVLDPASGRLESLDWFDTLVSEEESSRMARRLEQIPAGAIVVALVRDEGTANLSLDAAHALTSIGAGADLRGRFRAAHAVIGVKGARPGDAIEDGGNTTARVSVGRARSLGLVLRAFDLR